MGNLVASTLGNAIDSAANWLSMCEQDLSTLQLAYYRGDMSRARNKIATMVHFNKKKLLANPELSEVTKGSESSSRMHTKNSRTIEATWSFLNCFHKLFSKHFHTSWRTREATWSFVNCSHKLFNKTLCNLPDTCSRTAHKGSRRTNFFFATYHYVGSPQDVLGS